MIKSIYSLQEIADYIGAELLGDASVKVKGLSPLETAAEHDISFVSSNKTFNQCATTKASAIILPKGKYDVQKGNYLLVENPRLAFAKTAELFDVKTERLQGVHPSAIIEASSVIASTVIIGANVTIGHHCKIGENTIIKANAVIADHVEIGNNCIIHQGAVIGSDGFGNANEQGKWYKIPQIGGVKIANDVEIGANCAIDCGAIGDTIIHEGVRLDNLVHIAHNVEIGAHTAIAAQVGVAGSAKIGKHCMFSGQCAVNGHITICDGAIFTGKAVVTKSVLKPGVYSSNTGLMENTKWRKMVIRLRQLDDMARTVKNLEKTLLKGESE